MNYNGIDYDFARLISQRGVFRRLGMRQGSIKQMRYRFRHGIPISTDYKIKLLQRSGWQHSDKEFTHLDLVAAIKMALNSSPHTRQLGPEYIAEKYIAKKNLKQPLG